MTYVTTSTISSTKRTTTKAPTTYHVLDQDLWTEPGPALGEISPPVDLMELLRGRAFPPSAPPGAPPSERPLRIGLLPGSGVVMPDLLSYLLPLFSERLRNILDDHGVDNVEYRRADLIDAQGRLVTSYWLANVLGLVRCVDLDRSDAAPYLGNTGSFELGGFTIDPGRADGASLFRLAEHSQLLIVDEPLCVAIASADLRGVRLRPTEAYDGY